MTGTVHAAIGAAIGRFVKNKPLAFGLGVFSHFVGDVIPHKDLGPKEAPFLLGTLVLIAKKFGVNSPEFIGAIGGICPDFEHIPAEIKRDPRRFDPMPEKFFPTHNGKVHHGEWPYSRAAGIAMQVGLVIAGLYLAGALSRDE